MNDLGYMKNPMTWVNVMCPMKRYVDGRLQCAYLASSEPVLWHGNIWNPNWKDDREERFTSHEAILAAGWVVD